MHALPDELLLIVCSYLPLSALKAFSFCSHSARAAAEPYLYKYVTSTWDDLETLAGLPNITMHAESLSIRPVNPSDEWDSGQKLTQFANVAPKLQKLTVVCRSTSTAWLAYLGAPLARPLRQIKELSLVPAPNLVKNAILYFDFDNVYGSFPCLESLSLTASQIQCPALPLQHLKSLTLNNCTWWYPSTLADVSKCLEHLIIKVNNQARAFAYSERLQHDTCDLSPCLKSLAILIDIGQTVPWKPLQGQVPENLLEVHLRGFEPFARATRHYLPSACILHEEPPRIN